MGPTLSAVLDDARRRGFVGRAPELRSFAAALAGTGPVRVLFVHGPGGIGKSTLLDELRRRAVDCGRPALLLHGRDLGGSIEEVSAAVAALPEGAGPVLLVDGYELLSRLDRWFREHLLPSLPADSVVVLAGREPPAAAWWADPGWRQLLRSHDLGAMPAAESVELLCRLGVPADLRDRLAAVGRGHPLTLTLLAEACAAGGTVPTRLDELPHLVAELCRVLVREVPDAEHRTGLATCAHSYRTTEDLLAATVGQRAPEVWAWLRARPFVGHSGAARPGRVRRGGPGRTARPDPAGPLAGTALAPDVRGSLLAGIARLGDEPRGELLRRVLDRTYVRPAPSQEAAAEVLGLPFSTYRRHLGRATARLTDLLWAAEVGTDRAASGLVGEHRAGAPSAAWQRSSSSAPA